MQGEGGVAGSLPMSTAVYTGAQINFGDLTPYLTMSLGLFYCYILSAPTPPNQHWPIFQLFNFLKTTFTLSTFFIVSPGLEGWPQGMKPRRLKALLIELISNEFDFFRSLRKSVAIYWKQSKDTLRIFFTFCNPSEIIYMVSCCPSTFRGPTLEGAQVWDFEFTVVMKEYEKKCEKWKPTMKRT